MSDVFISYTTEDKLTADAVCAALESQNIRCWIAPRDALGGTDWPDSVLRGIEGSAVMVLVFSSNANRSQQIKREVNHAIEKGLPVIPFRIENVDPSGPLEYYLDVTHWLDALTPPMEQHIEVLVTTVARLLQKPTPKPAPAPVQVAPARFKDKKKLLWIGIAAGILALATIMAVAVLLTPDSESDASDQNIQPVTEADPIAKAASDLANPQLRVDAILRLEQLARKSKEDHWRVVQLLTEYIRKNAPWTDGANRSAKEIPTDIQTIMTVLGRRQWWYKNGEEAPLELSNTDLRGVDLRVDGGGAHFEGVRLENAHLEESNLRGIHFEDAILKGAFFTDTYLVGAHFGSDVNGKLTREADIVDADFEGADLSLITGIPISRIKSLAYTDGAKFD